MIANDDKRLIQGAALSSLQRLMLPLGVLIVLGVYLLKGIVSEDNFNGDQVTVILLALLLPVIVFLIGAVWAAARRIKVARLVRTPQNVSRIEDQGDQITIRWSDGGVFRFAVRRVPIFGSPSKHEVMEALSRLAPHAIAPRAN